MQDSEEEFLRLYDDEADALYRFVFLRMSDHDRAIDIVQETYLRVWRALSEGKVKDGLRAYLFKTARNLLIDTYRKNDRQKEDSLDRFFEGGGEVEDTTPDPLYVTYDLERVKKLLAELEPPEYREVLILRFVLEWTPKEISRVLETSENVVSVRINRAMKKLQAEFKP